MCKDPKCLRTEESRVALAVRGEGMTDVRWTGRGQVATSMGGPIQYVGLHLKGTERPLEVLR